MTGMWSQLQRCDNLRRSFTQSVNHVPDSSCDDCMDGTDCMTTKARGLCLDCMDGADCRKAPGCPGELDGGAHSSKLHSSSSEQIVTPIDVQSQTAEPPSNYRTSLTANNKMNPHRLSCDHQPNIDSL